MLSGYMADMFSLRIVFQGGCAFIVAWALLLTICLKCVVKKAKIRYSKYCRMMTLKVRMIWFF